MAGRSCKVCGVSHRRDIHEAVLRVKAWRREQIEKWLTPVATPKKRINRRNPMHPACSNS